MLVQYDFEMVLHGRRVELRAFALALFILGLLMTGNLLPVLGVEGAGHPPSGGRAAGDATFLQMDLPFSPDFAHGAWLPDGSSMVVAGRNGWILRYDPSSGTFLNISPPMPFMAPDMKRVAVSPATKNALVVGGRGTAMLVGPDDRKTVLDTGTTNDLLDASFAPDGSYAYVTGANATFLRYDAGTGLFTMMDALSLPGYGSLEPASSLTRVAFRPSGSYALVFSDTRDVYKATDTELLNVSSKFGTRPALPEVAWSPDGASAIMACQNDSVQVWNGASESVSQTSSIPGATLSRTAWMDNTTAYVVADGAASSLYRYSGSPTLTQTQKLGASFTARAICWRPDGKEAFLFGLGPTRSQVYRYREEPAQLALSVSSITDNSAYLSWTWNGSASIDHFGVYSSTSNTTLFDRPPVAVGSNRYYTLSSLQAERTYYVAVSVFLMTGTPQNYTSNVVSFTTLAARPVPAPSAPAATDINATSAMLSWSWSPGTSGEQLDHYLLYYSQSASTLASETPINAYTNTSGRLTLLHPSTTYYLMIRVVTRTNRSADSGIQMFSTTALNLPQAVSISVSGNRLEWMASSSPDIRTYEVYYDDQAGTQVGQMNLLGTRAPSTGEISFDLTPYMGTTFNDGSTYYFRVRTINRDGGVADSNEATFRYDTVPPRLSTGAISSITYNSVRLSWSRSSVSDFGAYIIEYREYLSGTWKQAKKITSQQTTSVVVDSLAPDTRYQFRIKVQDKAGNYSPVSDWATQPRTSENIPYSIYYSIMNEPEVCLPISFVLTFMSFGIAMGASKGGRRRGRALVGFAFAGGFGLVLLTNLAWVMGIFVVPFELKVLLFIIPFPIAAAVGIARWGQARARASREAEELRRRQDEMAQQELRQRADKVRAGLDRLNERMAAVQAMPKAPPAGAAKDALQRAGWAFQAGNILLAEEEGKRTEALVSELEAGAKDKQTQVAEMTRRLDALDGRLKGLIEAWQKANPAAELGLDMSRLDRARLEAARTEEDRRIQSAQAKAQQAGLHLEKDRLPDAREAATAAEAEIERLTKAAQDLAALKAKVLSAGPELENASSWAAIDSAAFGRRIESSKQALAYNDIAGASAQIEGVYSDLGKLEDTHTPSLAVSLAPVEFKVNRYEDFLFTVKNAGTALARDIEIGLEAPADFGPGKSGQLVKVPRLMPGESRDCRVNLCFLREGKVPVVFTIDYADHTGNRTASDPVQLSAAVVSEKAAVPVAPAVPSAPKGNIMINARPILQGGFFLYKLAVINHSGFGLADARVLISYKREILRFHHVSPPSLLDRFKYLQGEGEREDVLYLGYLDPLKDQEVTAELFYHPYICTETVIEAELCYRDVQGRKLTIPCEPKKFPCYCPSLGSVETPNPAMLLSFISAAQVKDSRVEPITAGVTMSTAFEVLKSVIINFGLAPVGSESVRKGPYHAEALFYGGEDAGGGKMLRYGVIAMVTERPTSGSGVEVGGVAEIHVACDARTKVTAMLATLAEQFNSALERQVNVKRPIYVDMREYKTVIKDSVIYKSSIGAGPGGTEIDGSVVSHATVQAPARSGQVFQSAAGPVTLPPGPELDDRTKESMAKYLESYRRAKFNDGTIDEEEHAFLDHLAAMYALSPELVRAVESKVDQEYDRQAGRGARGSGPGCPRCSAPVRAGDVICSNCGDLITDKPRS